MHLLWGALTGPAVIGSGCRLAPGEDPDALARDVLETRARRPARRCRDHIRPAVIRPCLSLLSLRTQRHVRRSPTS